MMEKYTKNNPGCIHKAINYLEELTGISNIITEIIQEKDLRYTRIDAKGRTRRELKWKSYNITIVDKSGIEHPYMLGKYDYTHPSRNIDVSHFIAKRSKSIKDFGILIEDGGSYTESLGGGWTTRTPMYLINGKYFACLKCSCYEYL